MSTRCLLFAQFLLGFAAVAPASTITWNLGGGGDLGAATHVFTAAGTTATITAYGYANTTLDPNLSMTGLWGKTGIGEAYGLGLKDYLSHEINAGTDFIQLDISALAGFTNIQFVMGSITPPDAWAVLVSGTRGTPGVLALCNPAVTCTGTDEGVAHTLAFTPAASGKTYLAFEATQGDALIVSISADTDGSVPAVVPEPMTIALMGLGLLGVGSFGRLTKIYQK